MNHEVIQAWWEEHEEIDELMTSIGSALGRKAFSAAYVLLGRLSATLERHFDTEESLYFPFVEQSSPGSGPLLERARSAHRKLRASLEDLHVLVESADAGSAHAALSKLLHGLHVHETLEVTLVDELQSVARSLPRQD